MGEIILRFLEDYPQFFIPVASMLALIAPSVFVVKNHQFFSRLFRRNNEEKIRKFEFYQENLGKKDKLLKKVLKHEIMVMAFVDMVGYYLNGKQRRLFLAYYNELKDEIPLRLFLVLFKNSKIKDGAIHLKVTRQTNVDLFMTYLLAALMILSFIVILILSQYVDVEKSTKNIVLFLLILLVFVPGLFAFMDASLKNYDLMKLKVRYHGKSITMPRKL